MIEFFSGIGGMRAAVQDLVGKSKDMDLLSCTAFEISDKANAVYRHNYFDSDNPNFSVRTKLVEQLKINDLPDSNLWTMSPPCQPFTRTRHAKQNDLEDSRTAGFVAILKLLQHSEEERRPKWIFLENVAGFVGSDAHNLFYRTLQECGYSWVDGLLSPIDLGVPNHRKRYFALCEKSDRFFQRNQIDLDHLPSGKDSLKHILPLRTYPVQSLSEYVDYDANPMDLIISESVFEQKWAKDLPVVCHLDTQSHCFTAAYSRQLHRATGSLLLMEPHRASSVEENSIDRSDMSLYKGKLRRFSTAELLKLFGFPATFSFPSDIDKSYQYKLIGNSVSVFVVKELLQHLLEG
jgi:tRNA (cytosine38-C5)-methyltransferase